mmetsp:Transcript_1054/g.1358  ORF Transcript_1054/g.1358 Transcript_1054/m.1358 type:complete len:88 (+) Transcript_1054:208-471(+)
MFLLSRNFHSKSSIAEAKVSAKWLYIAIILVKLLQITLCKPLQNLKLIGKVVGKLPRLEFIKLKGPGYPGMNIHLQKMDAMMIRTCL